MTPNEIRAIDAGVYETQQGAMIGEMLREIAIQLAEANEILYDIRNKIQPRRQE